MYISGENKHEIGTVRGQPPTGDFHKSDFELTFMRQLNYLRSAHNRGGNKELDAFFLKLNKVLAENNAPIASILELVESIKFRPKM